MDFNNVVNTAIKDRNELPNSQRGKLLADATKGICWLVIKPYNGLYVEESVGFYTYKSYNGKVERTWCFG